MIQNETVLAFVQELFENNRIPYHFISLPCEDFTWISQGLRKKLFAGFNQAFFEDFLSNFKDNTICHIKDRLQCCYSILRVPDSNTLMVCGPVIYDEMRTQQIQEIGAKIHLAPELLPALQNYFLGIASIPSPTFYFSIFLTFGNYLFGKDKYKTIYYDENDLEKWYDNYSAQYHDTADSLTGIKMIEMRYALEAEVLDAVFSGNEEKTLALVPKMSSILLPDRMEDPLRNQKDYSISFNTLLRKKAEEAGVHPFYIDICSNRQVQLIEQSTSKEQCTTICTQMMLEYCRLIRSHTLKNYSRQIQKAITYITSDLTADLSLKAISELLNINASYLSTLFKKEVGIPLTDFVIRQRIGQAKKLLIVTDLPTKTIARQCGIPDIYYFSRLFKRTTGVTPKIYRESIIKGNSDDAYKNVSFY